MSVRQGTVAPEAADDQKSQAAKPMRWATRRLTGQAVFICDLGRKETGLACDCICPSCKSPLQAVNAGVGPERFLRANARGQFFRHASGHQRDDCLVLSARLAALQLLVDRQEVDLPPPKRTASVLGVSGKLYPGEASGHPHRLRICQHTWIDVQHASITLDDGHVVLLRIDSRGTAGVEGGFDGIITITVDDPEVASWGVAEILAKMKLGQIPTCWDKHWDDEALIEQATSNAERNAAEHLDFHFPALGSLEGLTQAQKSESILHYVIKKILLEARSLVTPEFRETVHRHIPNAEPISRHVLLAQGALRISDATAECPVGNLVADVLCRAQAPGAAAFDLAIEVAVTHRVDEHKRRSIVALDLACLEVDVRGFILRGRVTLDALKQEVLGNPSNKRWVHHPLIAQLRAQANQALDAQKRALMEAADRARRAREWLESLPQEKLLTTYHQGLVRIWNGSPPDNIAGHKIELGELAARLVEKGLRGADEELMAGHNGVLPFLHLTRVYRGRALPPKLSLAAKCSSFIQSQKHRFLTTYLLVGLRVYKPLLPRNQADELNDIRNQVLDSLNRGESTFARPRKFDALVIALFPDLAESLAAEIGTQEHAASKIRVDHAMRQAKAQREHEQARQEGEARDRNRLALANAIDESSRLCWADKLGFARDVDQIMNLHDMKVAAKRSLARGHDARRVIASAWEARENGVQVTDWLRAQGYRSIADLDAEISLLRTAWMLKTR